MRNNETRRKIAAGEIRLEKIKHVALPARERAPKSRHRPVEGEISRKKKDELP